MTTDLSKIYDNLTPEQLALLAFNHLADDDDLERQRILSAVPQQTYRMNDWYFMRHSTTLLDVAMLIGIVYWQAQTAFFIRYHVRLRQLHQIELSQIDNDSTIELIKNIEQQIDTAAAKLLGTEQAIKNFIDRHGLNRQVIQMLTMTPNGFDSSKHKEHVTPCASNYNMITELLEGMMTI